jgi:hypothetical protein
LNAEVLVSKDTSLMINCKREEANMPTIPAFAWISRISTLSLNIQLKIEQFA